MILSFFCGVDKALGACCEVAGVAFSFLPFVAFSGLLVGGLIAGPVVGRGRTRSRKESTSNLRLPGHGSVNSPDALCRRFMESVNGLVTRM